MKNYFNLSIEDRIKKRELQKQRSPRPENFAKPVVEETTTTTTTNTPE